MKNITLDNYTYDLLTNYRDAFDFEALKEKYTEYFYPYDYISGDWSYGKLRLKGFYKKGHKDCRDLNDFDNLEKYIKSSCAYDCRYFVIEKVIE